MNIPDELFTICAERSHPSFGLPPCHLQKGLGRFPMLRTSFYRRYSTVEFEPSEFDTNSQYSNIAYDRTSCLDDAYTCDEGSLQDIDIYYSIASRRPLQPFGLCKQLLIYVCYSAINVTGQQQLLRTKYYIIWESRTKMVIEQQVPRDIFPLMVEEDVLKVRKGEPFPELVQKYCDAEQ